MSPPTDPASTPPSPSPVEPPTTADQAPPSPRKGPLSFLSGAITSGVLAWLALGLSGKVVGYYAAHPPHYSTRVAQSIATAVKTLVVGMTFLATFTFAFVGLGLFLTFLRSLWPSPPSDTVPEEGRPS
ncbi:MAG: DUF3082 domain-containing protein [Cyanobacteriota bacterium]|nr:DUF3082 domain-containing protein [Cyanobacteriota bacterium]